VQNNQRGCIFVRHGVELHMAVLRGTLTKDLK